MNIKDLKLKIILIVITFICTTFLYSKHNIQASAHEYYHHKHEEDHETTVEDSPTPIPSTSIKLQDTNPPIKPNIEKQKGDKDEDAEESKKTKNKTILTINATSKNTDQSLTKVTETDKIKTASVIISPTIPVGDANPKIVTDLAPTPSTIPISEQTTIKTFQEQYKKMELQKSKQTAYVALSIYSSSGITSGLVNNAVEAFTPSISSLIIPLPTNPIKNHQSFTYKNASSVQLTKSTKFTQNVSFTSGNTVIKSNTNIIEKSFLSIKSFMLEKFNKHHFTFIFNQEIVAFYMKVITMNVFAEFG